MAVTSEEIQKELDYFVKCNAVFGLYNNNRSEYDRLVADEINRLVERHGKEAVNAALAPWDGTYATWNFS